MPNIANPKNREVLLDALTISSGTMATLTGESRYRRLEDIQATFANFVVRSKEPFANWMFAWEKFWNSGKVSHF